MRAVLLLLVVPAVLGAPAASSAQSPGPTTGLPRLSSQILDVVPPSEWARGQPGQMTVQRARCRDAPAGNVRRRIVDIGVQEWGFFGFPVLDLTDGTRLPPAPARAAQGPNGFHRIPPGRRIPLLTSGELVRTAPSVAGYWAATPQGPGIVWEQNGSWRGPQGAGVRWRYPWSAAFVSWVMCEAGLGEPGTFRHAIAHWSYVDHAIRARDGTAPTSAFLAHEVGELPVEPGDLLCQSNRPAYRSVADRRRQMGVGARSHCDIVVAVDGAGERILTVGGNVLRAVTLKVFPASRGPEGWLVPAAGEGRPLFAHLKLRADPIEALALRSTPTLLHHGCAGLGLPGVRLAWIVGELGMETPPGGRC